MKLLEFFFIVSGIVLLLISYDIAKRQKFNALHFIVFLGIGLGLNIFTFFPESLNFIGKIFGLQRGADVLVYGGIIFLIYFSIVLLNKSEKNKEDITALVRELALEQSMKKDLVGQICFVMAAYNESKVIESTLNNLLANGYTNIIVINDGSKDDTRQKIEAYGDKIIVLNHFKNRGQGAALETGFEYIRRYGKGIEYVCTYDADGQHQLSDLPKFFAAYEKQPELDIVLGSRFVKKTNTNFTLGRKIILKLGILFTFVISNIKLTDSHNGFRLIRQKTLQDIRIIIDGMGHASEIVDIIATKKLKFHEVPVDILYTQYSLQKGQKSSNALNIALKTIWYKFFK